MKIKKACLSIFLLAIILLNLTIVYATQKNNYNLNNYFRIHVVANSDNIEDQIIKLKVADKVNNYIEYLTTNSNSKEESKNEIIDNIYSILSICKNTIKENNKDYNVKAFIGSIEYDEKSYNEYKFDSGIYDSLKIILGDGKGNNWWSLIYPGNLDLDNYYNSDITYSFKIIEIIKKIIN